MLMKRLVLSPGTFCVDDIAILLEKCLKARALNLGKQVHAWMLVTGIEINPFLNSKLVGVYASCGDLKSAGFLFRRNEKPNAFAVNWMVMASAFHGYYEEAIGYFSLMRESIHLCNKFTFSVVLKACVGLMDLKKGMEIHAMVNKMGSVSDVSVCNSLIDMYSKCGQVYFARRVFDRMIERDVASCTSMICGYCNVGKTEEALFLFQKMKLEGLDPNDFTWNAIIAGFAKKGDTNGALALLGRMTREGLVPDLVTLNAIISGFAQSQRPVEAIILFADMLASGIKPNPVTVTGLLPACGLTGSLKKGKEIHGLILRMGLEFNVFVGSALIDMYSKCGSVKDAKTVFEKIHIKNVISWNAMIGCYAKHGMVDSAIELFEKMQEGRIQSTNSTLTSVLSACSHGGSVEKGLKIFNFMKKSCGTAIAKEHYACVVDMLCRSGRMVEAYEFVEEIPFEITEAVIGAFFNGCQIHGRRDLAKLMAEKLMKMELARPGGFVTLSNIYAADGEWEEVEDVRKVMKENKIHKKPGFSMG